MLDTFGEVKVCVAHTDAGEPEYVVLPGWLTDISGARNVDDLPENAQALVRLVEREVGVPIRIVGTGAERDAYVMWS